MEQSTQEMLSVESTQKSLQTFGITDYCVFAGTVLFSTAIGLYYSFKGKSNSSVNETEEYLLGGRTMSVIPIGFSLIASFISGITYLGAPTEMYLHGTEYMFSVIGVTISGYLASHMVLPVFHDLHLSSSYEYLQMRYDGKVQMVGSVIFAMSRIIWLPIAIYLPSLAFNLVTGVNVHITTTVMCLFCIFYTSMGGLKAVVWSDVGQTVVMVGALFVTVIKGTNDVGGLGKVWRLNWESDRIEVPSFSLDPTIRHSMISLTVWGTVYMLQGGALEQQAMQRFLTLPTVSQAKSALWLFVAGYNFFVLICGYAGLLAYATYHDCDPLTTGLAKAKDQLLPLLAMRVLGGFPGMPGLFIAGVFSAALSSLSTALNSLSSIVMADFIKPNRKTFLFQFIYTYERDIYSALHNKYLSIATLTFSSLSTGLNSMSAVVLEDFIKPHRRTPLSDRATRYILRSVVIISGVCSVGLVFVVEQLGTILQLWIYLSAITSGASVGLFFGGLLIPCLNAKGALWGSIAGMSLCAAYIVTAQRALAVGGVTYPNKMTSVEGCAYSFPAPVAATELNSTIMATPSVFPLYQISYLYYIVFGAIVTIICSAIISYATGGNDYKNMDPRFFSPVIRRWLPKQTNTGSAPEEEELLDMVPKAQLDE